MCCRDLESTGVPCIDHQAPSGPQLVRQIVEILRDGARTLGDRDHMRSMGVDLEQRCKQFDKELHLGSGIARKISGLEGVVHARAAFLDELPRPPEWNGRECEWQSDRICLFVREGPVESRAYVVDLHGARRRSRS